MNVLDWLAGKQDGFGDLPKADLKQMMEFSLLWAYFEANLLAERGSPERIARLASELAESRRARSEWLAAPLAYWRDRYVREEKFTRPYGYLNLRANDNVDVVNAVLLGKDESARSLLICALTIVYRYRNNLFHGAKWAYGLRDQKENFQVASNVLMAVTEMTRREPSEDLPLPEAGPSS